MKVKRLMLMAGGTGGHIFSGLPVAQHLIKQGWEVCWLGTSDHMEASLIPQQGIPIKYIRISGLRGKGIITLVLSPIKIFNAWYQAYRIMKEWQPDIVLGMGGYVSGPGGLAAWSCGIPLVLHEQNRIAGLTNKLLAKIATNIMQAFPNTFPQADIVGNPIRDHILTIKSPKERFNGRTGPIRVLVLGGSQGSKILNQKLPAVAKALVNKIIVWHQTGQSSKEIVQQAYSTAGQLQYKITEFIDDIAEAYSWADVVICRSGALTVSEVAIIGIPAIFIPFPHKDRQQYWNALPLQKVGAAKILQQQHFTTSAIVEILSEWQDRVTLLAMAEKARQVAIFDSTNKIVQIIIRIHNKLIS
ncbi:undecaprenyldiphospho-muramoylpentapeptide beta-N-acetylglucosaminyltransferase [Pantoea sp. Mhis]|uniref:undecaprenyldiphospho-muramoylpentapeptide beta-N-acetylglucosaminyltransferase n=1 Tax=Pantoea sp. Mhis TaxID=2576759 RepID=UPI0013591C43|nr:undecaprenyldiphospho-muramoylpentapeptide beta-N-acetylglucosaminyltransferase [Pantoea sp. Mhis]MXP56496.1 undecaprenyldiphospho-muramoylpentapeptide beta-N-acetylglucosaminyltransferase [Pantoea sp. Mhis]